MGWARNGKGTKWDTRAPTGMGPKWDGPEMARPEVAGPKWVGPKWPGPKLDRPDLSYKKWNKTHHIDGISLRSIPPIISKKMTFKVQVLEIFIRFSLEFSPFNVLGVLNNFLNVESTL